MPSIDLRPSGESKQAAFPRLSGYTILEKAHESSVCAVYKARQDRLGRIVALKLLPEWPPPNDVAFDRFNRAAYAAAQARQKNLATLFETGTLDGFHYATLEWIPGRSLHDLMTEKGRLSEQEALGVALQTARALAELHGKNIIHRNVKPKNVRMEPSGQVRLIGLGLAKCPVNCFSKQLDEKALGTPHYMAPEIVRGCCVDPRCDLYSLGVMLHVMVCGDPPFGRGIPAAVMAKHVYENPRPVRDVNPDVSPAFAQLVADLLRKCPKERLGPV